MNTQETIPCKQCLLRVMCINREFMPLFNSCPKFKSYILISSNRVSMERLYEYGKTMDVRVKRSSRGDVRLIYNRESLMKKTVLVAKGGGIL